MHRMHSILTTPMPESKIPVVATEQKHAENFENLLKVLLNCPADTLAQIIHAPHARKIGVLIRHLSSLIVMATERKDEDNLNVAQANLKIAQENRSHLESCIQQNLERLEAAIILRRSSPASVSLLCNEYKREYAALIEKGECLTRAKRIEGSKTAIMHISICLTNVLGYMLKHPDIFKSPYILKNPTHSANLLAIKEELQETVHFFRKERDKLYDRAPIGAASTFSSSVSLSNLEPRQCNGPTIILTPLP
ncbi:hypothetical protein BH10PSE19_BH10PSE19_04680 [soil metagenome]